MLYALVFGLAPRRCLEVGSFYGGSALITSGALDDVQLGGRLLCIDPDPSQIKIDWSAIAHNAELIGGFFPQDFPPRGWASPPRVSLSSSFMMARTPRPKACSSSSTSLASWPRVAMSCSTMPITPTRERP